MTWNSATVVIIAIAVQATACGTNNCDPPPDCPATSASIQLSVTSSAGSGAVAGVEVTFSGTSGAASGSGGTMTCDDRAGSTVCSWSSGPVVAGDCEIQVTAPGYQLA